MTAPSPLDPAVLERILVESFVVPRKRARTIELLSSPRRRSTVVESLYHYGDLDPRCVVPIPPAEQLPSIISAHLRARGAGEQCYAISTEPELDGRLHALEELLESFVGCGAGLLLICVGTRVGYFEGEAIRDRCILDRG